MSPTERPGGAAPRLVLGTAQIGQCYGIANRAGRPSRGTVESIIRAARDHGVNHLDTARAYGASEAELGAAAPVGQPPAVITKIAPLAGRDAAHGVRRSWEESAAALDGKSADVTDVLLHRATDATIPGVWAALRRLRDEVGFARIGVSVQTPTELLDVLRFPDLEHVQLPFNVLDRRWLSPETVGALTARSDVVVVARSVFLQGLLITGGRWPRGHDGTRILAPLDELVTSTGSWSRTALCVRFALAQPWVDAVVIGAETPEQVVENAALAALPALEPNDVDEALQRVPAGALDLVDPSRWER